MMLPGSHSIQWYLFTMAMNAVQLSRVDLNLLILFEVMLEESHVGRAAGRLHLTPSAVSHGLGRLRRLLNDPLFLRTPKGMVASERALALRAPLRDILASIGAMLGLAVPFDPERSERRFVVGAPDAVLASLARPLWTQLTRHAGRIDLGLVHLMPNWRERSSDQPWKECLHRVERRELDIAVLPLQHVARRFHSEALYEEDFVVAARRGHRFARDPSIASFVAAKHLLVSSSGDPRGSVEALLEAQRLKRRIALTVPSFALALDLVASSDLLATLPRRFVAEYGPRVGIKAIELPLERNADTIRAVTTKAAMADPGIRWLVSEIAQAVRTVRARRSTQN